MKNSGTQIPSFRPLSTLRPWRTRSGSRGSVTTACPSAASVGARMTASRSASGHDSEPKRTRATPKPASERQRQPEAEQTSRDRDLVPERAEVDPRRVAEEDERERRLGQQLDRLAGDRRVDEPEGVGADEQPDRREHHRRSDRRAVEPAARRPRNASSASAIVGSAQSTAQTLLPGCRRGERPAQALVEADGAARGDRARDRAARHGPVGLHRAGFSARELARSREAALVERRQRSLAGRTAWEAHLQGAVGDPLVVRQEVDPEGGGGWPCL